ncbi:hypothetical protein BpHYR1_012082 [Brachionus plicatilis]|uniref:Uncharacterized protein n=1 Tax=Brachionus plicatilis TaxID=10195 RepID=A0A3M7SSR4_BRAPC|nr:hypothetical protein BpHYR1_012082 [Brachionus plicatilis]
MLKLIFLYPYLKISNCTFEDIKPKFQSDQVTLSYPCIVAICSIESTKLSLTQFDRIIRKPYQADNNFKYCGRFGQIFLSNSRPMSEIWTCELSIRVAI